MDLNQLSKKVLSLGQFASQISQQQLMMAKLLFVYMDKTEGIKELRRSLHKLPDCQEARDMERELDAKESEASKEITALAKPFPDEIARLQSSHDQLDALLADLKSQLPPEP